MMSEREKTNWTSVARKGAADPVLAVIRSDLVVFTAAKFCLVGNELHRVGHIFGKDRVNGDSPGGHGSDELVAVSLLLQIAGELSAACAELFAGGKQYAAAALLRQLVEIEYLAWAFDARDKDGERWLRSTQEERQSFFTPAKLRQAANGRFRGKDYGYHCELGGHPVPGSFELLKNDQDLAQLLVSDLLGHTGRTWDHIADWAEDKPFALLVVAAP